MDTNVAKEYAIKHHELTNCFYGEYPYSYHLSEVVQIALSSVSYAGLTENEKTLVLCACWTHDVIEDTSQTYSDVARALGVEVADICYDVTNELGKNRKERALKTYPKIAQNKLARFVKLCDRIANMRYSKNTQSSMFNKYIKEHKEFSNHLKVNGEFEDLWDQLENLVNG